MSLSDRGCDLYDERDSRGQWRRETEEAAWEACEPKETRRQREARLAQRHDEELQDDAAERERERREEESW